MQLIFYLNKQHIFNSEYQTESHVLVECTFCISKLLSAINISVKRYKNPGQMVENFAAISFLIMIEHPQLLSD